MSRRRADCPAAVLWIHMMFSHPQAVIKTQWELLLVRLWTITHICDDVLGGKNTKHNAHPTHTLISFNLIHISLSPHDSMMNVHAHFMSSISKLLLLTFTFLFTQKYSTASSEAMDAASCVVMSRLFGESFNYSGHISKQLVKKSHVFCDNIQLHKCQQ